VVRLSIKLDRSGEVIVKAAAADASEAGGQDESFAW
jgi:hypothetical protein